MARTYKAWAGSGVNGAFVDGDPIKLTPHIQPLKDDLDLIGLGVFQRNVYGGGDENFGIPVGVGTGYTNVANSLQFVLDNTNSQVSNAANLVCQVRVSVRVADGSISVTPQVFNVTDSNTPTQSGAVACSATALDFSGANSVQTLSFTPATGKKTYVVQVKKSADTFQVWCARIAWDVYISN